MIRPRITSRLSFAVLVLVLLSGCLRPASLPTVDLAQFTPAPDSAEPATEADAVEAVPSPTGTPELDPDTQATLRRYPLWVGSSWVYTYVGYTREKEVTWRVVETVVATQIVEGYYVATVERSAELMEGTPDSDFPYKPEEGVYYELVDGQNLYRSEGQIQTDLDAAWLDLVIPFPEVWYPDPRDRASAAPPETGYKYASDPFDQALPEDNSMRVCYKVALKLTDGNDEGTFCDGVGFVYREAARWDSGEGFRSEMVGFSLQ